jgi:macrocin-O-methyltransferase TylF-like protien
MAGANARREEETQLKETSSQSEESLPTGHVQTRVPKKSRSRRLKWRLEAGLTRLGAFSSAKLIYYLDSAISYLEIGRWMRAHGFDTSRRVTGKHPLFDLIAGEVRDKEVLYLEFGVLYGQSMSYWSKALRNPRSKLHGFDSFEGLPDNWNAQKQKGHFSTAGEIPKIDDPRVQFFKGWFEKTLPYYSFPKHEVLVANLDADLYSSTICALRMLEPELRPGSYLYFDQFMDRHHELKAFDEFIRSNGMQFRLRAANMNLSAVVFQRV